MTVDQEAELIGMMLDWKENGGTDLKAIIAFIQIVVEGHREKKLRK